MKKYFGLIVVAVIVVFCYSCKKECVCVGSHPSTEQVEEHSYGKMTADECSDKQLRMNKDTVVPSILFWTCSH